MAEPISIQQLKDASLDVKSLEEVVNGNETKQVTTRLGESYPSVKKAIKTLFENGGLPATPFATKALMTASTLVDGDYAQVTDDTVNNGLYIKTAGAWVKSSYDPLTLAKAYADTNISSIKKSLISKGYKWEEQDLDDITNERLLHTGAINASNLYRLSGYIAVKAGECLVLVNNSSNTTNETLSAVSFYNGNKDFEGSLSSGRTLVTTESKNDPKMLIRAGVFSSDICLNNIGVIAPSDGFVRICYKYAADKEPLLFRTDYKGFLENTLIQERKSNMLALEGKLRSVIFDQSVATKGIKTITSNIGEPVLYDNYDNLVSIKYPVTKGDYIHLQVITSNTNSARYMSLEDAAGNFLGVLDEITPTTLSGSGEGVMFLNYKVEASGFLRVQHANGTNVACLIAITKEAVSVTQDYLKKGQSIDFYEGSIPRASDSTVNSLTNNKWSGYGNVGTSTTNPLCRSLPYLLKKGEVLEFTVNATLDPMLFLAVPNKLKADKNVNNTECFIAGNAIEIFDLEGKGVEFLKDPVLNKVYVGDAKKGTAAYCNEYEDTVIVFIRPRKDAPLYAVHNCDNSYSLDIMDKDSYIVKRNRELEDRFKTLSKYSTDASGMVLRTTHQNADFNTHGSYPAVLMFKGEVLNCLTGSKTVVKGTRLRNPNLADEKDLHTPAGSDRCVYNTSLSAGIHNLPIRANDEFSYSHTQVYAQESCLVYVGFSALAKDNTTLLDVDRLIRDSAFVPRIVQLSDARIGDNIKPTLVRGSILYFIGEGENRRMSTSFSGVSDSYISFAPAGSYIESSALVNSPAYRVVTAPINKLNDTAFVGLPKNTEYNYIRPVGESADLGYSVGVRDMLVRVADKIEVDSVVAVPSGTRIRDFDKMKDLDNYDSIEANNVRPVVLPTDTLWGIAHKKILNKDFSHFVKSITKDEYSKNYEVTEKTFFHIPDTDGIQFNFCEVVSSSIVTDYWSVVQIMKNNEVIAVFNGLVANQGQTSASAMRKNINIEFYNSEGDDVYIKFGDHLPQSEYVLKSYLTTDKGHFKDAMSTDLWVDMRRANPYPIGGVFPKEVFEDISNPENQLARGTTFGFPVESYMGGAFYSLGSIRTKKKRENYAMEKSNKKHILFETVFMGGFTWSNIDISSLEVRNPKISGYDEGDPVLPVGYEGVEADIKRLSNWSAGVMSGAIDIKTTYKDYIHLESFIDYIIGMFVMHHWDSQNKNFLLGTHDGNIWRAYWYDLDATWGGRSGGVVIDPLESPFFGGTSLFKVIYDNFQEEIKRRYRQLRELNIVDIRKQQAVIRDYNSKMTPEAKKLDADYWGEVMLSSSVPYVMDWTNSRFKYLDVLFDYVDPSKNLVVQSVFSAMTVAAGATTTINYTNTSAKIGDVLNVEVGGSTDGLVYTAVCTVEGTVVLSVSNSTAEPISTVKTFLNITREYKYD